MALERPCPIPGNVQVSEVRRRFWFLLAVAALIPLLAFQRFSAIRYPVIRQEDILNRLVPASNDQSEIGQQFCQLDLNRLQNYQVTIPVQRKGASNLPDVEEGGVWKPTGCRAKYQVIVIVPYRDREDHLTLFLQIIHPFLQTQLLDYKIVVVEQTAKKPFNRAMLFNVGFLESKVAHGHIDCLIFHDVDLMPLDARNIYACMKDPRHLSSHLDQFRFNLPYVDLFGGAVAILAETFEEVDGFSNRFFGWGGEDDDFRQNRLRTRNLVRLEPPLARYTSLRHVKAEPSTDRFENLAKGQIAENKASVGKNHESDDGLASIAYKLIEITKQPLYTHIVVEL